MSSNEVPSDGTDPIEVQIWKIMMKNKAIDNSADYAGFTSMVKEIAQGDAPQGKEVNDLQSKLGSLKTKEEDQGANK
eukprot:m.20984 g.20984  ORF g.20984 m.20984 type:complete len:77 (+) comp7005_c0_seq1:110-340(+)